MAGRPYSTTSKRVKMSTTVYSTTNEWLKRIWDERRLSKGQTIDWLVSHYGEQLEQHGWNKAHHTSKAHRPS